VAARGRAGATPKIVRAAAGRPATRRARPRRTVAARAGLDGGRRAGERSPVDRTETTDVGGAPVAIRRLSGDDEAAACATIMSTSDPWLTLGRTFDRALAVVRDPDAEVYVAVARAGPEAERAGANPAAVVGFLVLSMRGAFPGYVRTVAARADWRGRGLGTVLLGFAERRILRDVPNVFLCVSSFNGRARALYLRLGYEVVGELRDYIVRGHSEWLLRKSVAPVAEFRPGRRRVIGGRGRAPRRGRRPGLR
jgi:ribosomal protein S18 acetylase RimI-like enzyme